MTTIAFDLLSNDELAAETRRVAGEERRSMAELLTLLIEVERRGLHLALGHSSMFVYCVRALRLSEQRRIVASLRPGRAGDSRS